MTDELGSKTVYEDASVTPSAADEPPVTSHADATSAAVAGAGTEERRSPDELRIGTVLDERYVVEAKLGEGGMGVVYRGRHRVIDKRVAIKVLRRSLSTNSEMSERFLNEARAASRVGSPHIVDISDFGRLPDGGAYFVMEYLDGASLSEVLRAGRMPAARIVHIGKQLARGLAAAHATGIVHRDLKPDNVMLVTRGADRDVVKILDFGIAKVGGDSQRLTRAGSVFGTPHYMSPEQAAGVSVDKLSDVYALGVIFYEMTSGSVPFDADSFMAILTQHMYKAPIAFRELALPPPDILPGFEELVLKCLAKKPEDRYASMDELLAELERIERGELSKAAESGIDPATYAIPADYYGDASLAIPAKAGVREAPRAVEANALEASPAGAGPRGSEAPRAGDVTGTREASRAGEMMGAREAPRLVETPRAVEATTTGGASVAADVADIPDGVGASTAKRSNARVAWIAGAVAIAGVAGIVAVRSAGSSSATSGDPSSSIANDERGRGAGNEQAASTTSVSPEAKASEAKASEANGAEAPRPEAHAAGATPPVVERAAEATAGSPSAGVEPAVAPKTAASVAASSTKPKSSPKPPTDTHAKPTRASAKPVASAAKPPQEAAPPPASTPARPQTRPPTCALEDWDPFEHKCAR